MIFFSAVFADITSGGTAAAKKTMDIFLDCDGRKTFRANVKIFFAATQAIFGKEKV
jgi:hypothetical protein